MNDIHRPHNEDRMGKLSLFETKIQSLIEITNNIGDKAQTR